MTVNKSVAVIIPFYNGAKWVERAIKSVAEQTICPDEFFVVNDGALPSERAFLEGLREKYSFQILDKENGGQGSARNAGVSATKSAYICFLDQDDFYYPRHIEDLLGGVAWGDPRFGYVYGDFSSANEAGEINHSNSLRQVGGRHPKVGHILEMVGGDLFVLPSASMISRCAFEAVGGFDPQFRGYEDDDLFLRMFRLGYSSHFIDRAVYVWCMHGGSTSWSFSMSRSRFRYFKKLVDWYPDDVHNGVYPIRDGLLARFGPAFLKEAIKARYGRIDNASEIIDYYRYFVGAVCGNPYVDKKTKSRLRFSAFVVDRLPIPLFGISRLVRRAARAVR